MTWKKIKRVFIANRGEICRRIAVTARKHQIQTVALRPQGQERSYLSGLIDFYSEAENSRPNIYMDPEYLVTLAHKAGCDALHPGFGFLSEHADFAKAVQAKGMIWIGPPWQAMEAMAEKSQARLVAKNLGVPLVAGIDQIDYLGDKKSCESTLSSWIKTARFPLILKASAGGGGRGMNICISQENFFVDLERTSLEAQKAFGNANLVIEQYIERSRHIEVQILGDNHGTVLAIGDRDCSVQRRRQKVIEEAPAPHLNKATREALQQSAVALARHVGYQSAGTVEFIVDWSKPPVGEEICPYYFLEMNTRLQVEHPCTEQAFGVDLVAWQFKVAQGEKIDVLEGRKPICHAIEVRLYAEDPTANFFPAPGIIHSFKPYHCSSNRWEQGLDGSDEISANFDPMIAKAIAWDEDRSIAISHLKTSLANTVLLGPPNNKEYLQELLSDSEFAQACAHSKILPECHDKILAKIAEEKAQNQDKVQALGAQLQIGLSAPSLAVSSERILEMSFTKGSKPKHDKEESFFSVIDQKASTHPIYKEWSYTTGKLLLKPNDDAMECIPFVHARSKQKTLRYFLYRGLGYSFLDQREHYEQQTQTHEDAGEILAPVPGKVVRVLKSDTDSVKIGEPCFLLESMKMEYEVKARRNGLIGSVSVKIGEQVTSGQMLARIT